MSLSSKAQLTLNEASGTDVKLGDLRKLAKEIKRDHELGLELWSSGNLNAQLLASLILDKRLLSQDAIDELESGTQHHSLEDRIQIADWLLANQLSKHKKTISLLESWRNSPSSIQRRLFWYYQARLRWVGQDPPDNTEDLLIALETGLLREVPEVQWAMNLTAGWIGVFDAQYRKRCIKLGESTLLYKDDPVARGCTPSYLPEFIRIEAGKRS